MLKSIISMQKMVKIFFMIQTNDILSDVKNLPFISIKIFFKKK